MPDILHSASQGGYDDEGLRRPLPQEDWPYNGRPNGGSDRRYGDHGPRFEKNIYIRKDQILFDIDTQMSIVAKARRRQDDTEEETLSSGSSPYQSLFERWIDRYSGLAKGVMSAFVLERAHKGEMNDIKGETEQTITLLMPAYWDDTVFQQLSQSVHDYIVNSCLYEYFALTLTSKDPLTETKHEAAINAMYDIKRFVNACKPGRVDKTLQPF